MASRPRVPVRTQVDRRIRSSDANHALDDLRAR